MFEALKGKEPERSLECMTIVSQDSPNLMIFLDLIDAGTIRMILT
jgi:hypothetical protein